ncbi:alcohol oxidase [Desarmillaria tabescens]|uniref:Alcohol oxidase n=1 Tax=Armillaria tabescens TaxID=1929756 RepID=A0AA39JU06_ARMTA|nr:alcohol oxidase [Desarmillaria tabescens]KAK0448896.1 alcohol oxidase [Desarmillaria tabescens]
MISLLLLILPLCLAAIYERAADLPTQDFDYIIVGGGTAGNVLANRLTEQPDLSILVLEAGRSTADVLTSLVPFFCTAPEWPLDWNFTTIPQLGLNGRVFPYLRGFGLGGCSATNIMTYTRGSSEDYGRYARLSGDEGWRWDQMQPYFQKNERFVAPADHHNITGQYNPAVHNFEGINSVSLAEYPSDVDGRVIQATKELSDEFPFNLDYNSGYHLGVGWHQKTIGNGTRSSSETSYLGSEYINRVNLYVLVNSHVTRILVATDSTVDDESEPYFNSVEFTQDAGKTTYTLSAREEIILSAGVIGTPHILLNSGVGSADELSALGITPMLHLPDVGKNMTDQVSMRLSWAVNDTQMVESVYWRNETFQEEVLAKWQSDRSGFLANPPSNQLGFFRLKDVLMEEESCAGNQTGHYELVFSGGMDTLPVPAGGSYFTALVNILCPLSRGNVTVNSTNPLSPPVINPNVLTHAQDLMQMKHAIGGAQRFAAAPVWADYILELSVDIGDLEGSIRTQARPAGHSVGTASMSPLHAHWGVVDPDLKLKRAKGVRIVDASVLPYVPAAHTQAPVYAVAERAADLIKRGKFPETHAA